LYGIIIVERKAAFVMAGSVAIPFIFCPIFQNGLRYEEEINGEWRRWIWSGNGCFQKIDLQVRETKERGLTKMITTPSYAARCFAGCRTRPRCSPLRRTIM
jgi:hypothetical protein